MYEADSGSKQFVVEFMHVPTEDFTHRERYTLTSGRAKGQKNYYERNGKKIALPGFSQANNLVEIITGKDITQLDFDKRHIPIYNPTSGQREPTEMDVAMDLIGKVLKVGMVKVRKNKSIQVGSTWQDGPDEIEINEIEKNFTADGHTLTEAKAKADPTFIEKWKAKRVGEVIDTYKPIASSGAPVAGAPPAPSGAPAAPAKSLFDD